MIRLAGVLLALIDDFIAKDLTTHPLEESN